MTTTEEIIVALRADGAQQTQSDIDGVEEGMNDVSDSVGNTADELQGFQTRFQGALTAAVGALAVAAGGLLTQVPVISEVFSGLGAVITAVAFQMDEVLRPVLTPITDLFFGVADSIFDADGAMGTFIGVVGSVVGVLGALLGIITTVAVATGNLAALKGGLILAGKLLVGALGAVVAAVGAVPLAIAAAVVGLGVLVFMFREEIVDAISAGLDALRNFTSNVVAAFLDLSSDLASWASGLASDAWGWGRDLIDSFILGIRSAIDVVTALLEDIPFIGTMIETLRTLAEILKGEDFDLSGSLNVGATELSQSVSDVGSRLAGGSSGGSSINLDGRRLTEDTGRYSFDESARRSTF